MRTLSLDVVATRGGVVESRHRVHAAVVGADDRLAAASGDAGPVEPSVESAPSDEDTPPQA